MPKFLGMEPKTWLWVGGGIVALIVVYYAMRARSGGGGDVSGGGGLQGGGIGGSSPVSYAPGAPDSSGDRYQQQLNDLDVQARTEALREQQAMFELQQEQGKQQLGLWGAQQSLLFQGAQQEQELQLGYEKAASQLQQAQLAQVTNEVSSGKIKGECGKGESSYYDRNTGQFLCKKSGKSGIDSLADTVGGAIQDWAGRAIPQYLTAVSGGYGGYSGYGGQQQGQQAQQQRTGYYTPPIAPQGAPYARNQGSGMNRSIDYGQQHFNVPGNLEQFPRVQ